MTDRIVLTNMVFEGRHGATPVEHVEPQPFEVDVELHLNLRPAGQSDDLTQTVDYRLVFEVCRSVIEGRTRDLIEALAETIAERVLAVAGERVETVVVRVRKPKVQLPGRLAHAGVEIVRRRAGA